MPGRYWSRALTCRSRPGALGAGAAEAVSSGRLAASASQRNVAPAGGGTSRSSHAARHAAHVVQSSATARGVSRLELRVHA